MRVVAHSAVIQDRDGAGLVLDKIRRRFPWLDLIWAEGVYNAWQVDAAVKRCRRCAWRSSPSAGKTRSVEYQITAPIASAVAKTGAAPLAQPSPYPEPTNQIKQRRQIPHSRHQRRRELPRGFLPRGFSDACLRAAPPPGDWQASENP